MTFIADKFTVRAAVTLKAAARFTPAAAPYAFCYKVIYCLYIRR